MTVEGYVKQIFPITCKGRNASGGEALAEPVKVDVTICKSPGSNTISSTLSCPYNTGAHGQRCRASHPEGVDKVGDGVGCPYAFDIPYALEKGQVY